MMQVDDSFAAQERHDNQMYRLSNQLINFHRSSRFARWVVHPLAYFRLLSLPIFNYMVYIQPMQAGGQRRHHHHHHYYYQWNKSF